MCLTGSWTRQLWLNVSFQVFVFLFTDDTVKHDEEHAEANREESGEDQLVPPAILGKDAPSIHGGSVVGDKASAEQKYSKHYKNDAYVQHADTCDHLQQEKGPQPWGSW